MFVNELFEDRYRIYRLYFKSREVKALEIKHSPEEIATFEPITLSVEGQGTRAAGCSAASPRGCHAGVSP